MEILKNRGLNINDENEAIDLLSKYNYFRLSGYSLTLRKDDVFYPNVSFSNLIEIYECDMAMRKAVFYLLDDIEITLRTNVSYYFAKEFGPLGYLEKNSFSDEKSFLRFQEEYEKEIERNSKSEKFLEHYKEDYEGQYPIWVLVETLSFGMVSRLYSNLPSNLQNEIVQNGYRGITNRYLKNWLHGLVILRNICAHRGRLFNRPFPYAIKLSKQDTQMVFERNLEINKVNKNLFTYILIMKKLVASQKTWENFIKELNEISTRYSFVDFKHYGFWDDWKEMLDIQEN